MLGKFITIINNQKEKDKSCEKFFSEMGQHFIDCYFYSLYEKEKKNLLKSNKLIQYSIYDWRDKNKNILDKYKDVVLVHNIGAILVEWLRDVDLVEFDLVKSLEQYSKRNINIVKLSERIKPKIKNVKLPLNLPNNLPMIIKPNRCYKMINKKGNICEHLGGYLLNGEKYYKEVIIRKSGLKHQTKILDENLVYESVNGLNSVGYKINKQVLNFIRLYGIKFGLVIGDSYVHP
jgi:DNA-directed RNA polymerase